MVVGAGGLAWAELGRGLTAVLPLLAERSFLVVSWSVLPPVYVEFAQSGSELVARTGGDDVLPPGHRLGAVGAQRLAAAGWSRPEGAGSGSWRVVVGWPARAAAYERLAEQCVGVFRDVHGVGGAEELEYRAWREAEPDPVGVGFDPAGLAPYEPHLVWTDLPIPDAQAGGDPAPVADRREVPVSDLPHPLVDQAGTGSDGTPWSITESRSPVVWFNPARANLLALAARDGRRPVLVTDERSSLTPAFLRLWRSGRGSWVVREAAGGLRNGFTGRRLSTIEQAWTLPPPQTVDEVAVNHLRPVPAETLQVTAIIAERHPARASTLLGETVEQLATTVLGAPPRAWGPHEPVGRPWDRRELTSLLREQLPADTTVIVTGPGLAGTVSARRTRHGIEEATHVSLAVEPPDEDGLARLREQLAAVLDRRAASAMPLAGLVLARPGRRDLLVDPFLTAPPVPLVLLVGAPAIRRLDPDLDALHAQFGARAVGRRRIPALLADLGPLDPQAWQRLDDLLGAFDPEVLAAELGTAATELDAVRLGRTDGPGGPDAP